jgi:hypothetical protein
MNPWLLIAAAGGLLALVASKKSATAPQALAPAAAPPASGGGGPPLTATNIQRAFLVAMRTERNPANLIAFGNALIAYGYPKQGAELVAQAAKVMTPKPTSAPVTSPLSGGLPPDAHVDPASGYVTSKALGGLIGRMDQSGNVVPVGGGQAVDPKTGKPVAGTSEFGPSGAGLGKNDINYWVNRYATTSLKVGDLPTKAQVQTAVANAMKYEKNYGNLMTFANILQAYGYGGLGRSGDAAEVQAKGLSENAAALAPFVKKYAHSSNVDHASLLAAVDNAKRDVHATPQDLLNFGGLLTGFSDFGLDWSTEGAELVMLAGQRAAQQAIAASQHGGHHS